MRVLTDWHPGTIEPVRQGLYLVERWDGDYGELFRWNCNNWYEASSGVVCPELLRSRWRGLAFDPDAAVFVPSGGKIVDIFYPDSSDAYVVEVPR